MCQGGNLFLPFFRALRRFRQFHGRGDRVRRESVFCDSRHKRPALISYTAQQFAAGQVEGLNDYVGILFQFLKIQSELFRPQIIQGRHRPVGQAQQMHDLADEDVSFRRLSQHVEADMDLAVLQFFYVSVEFGQVVFKGFCFIVGNRFVQLCFVSQFQNLFLQLRGLFRIFFLKMAVLVCHFFQLRQLVESARFRHGGGQVTDEAGTAPAFGDDAFAGDGHQVGVNVGQAAQGDVRIAGTVQPRGLAGQPFQVAMGAQVDHRVRLEHFPQPVIKCKILVGGRDGRIVVGPGGVHAVLAGGLHRHKHVAVHGTGH